MNKIFIGFMLGVTVALATAFGMILLGVSPERWLDRWLTGTVQPGAFPEHIERNGIRFLIEGNERQKITFVRDEQAHSIQIPEGFVYRNPVFQGNGEAVYVLEFEVREPGWYDYSAVIRFSIPQFEITLSDIEKEKILIPSELELMFEGARTWVERIYGVSRNGNVLLSIATEDQPDSLGRGSRYFRYPYWYDPNDESIERVYH